MTFRPKELGGSNRRAPPVMHHVESPFPAVTILFEQMTALSVPGSWLGCELKNTEMLTSPQTRSWIELLAREGVSWISSIDEPEAFLAECGWRATVVEPGEDGAHFGRWPFPLIPRSVSGVPRTFFVTARRLQP